MRLRIFQSITTGFMACLLLTGAVQAQVDAAKVYKANCELCHGTDGSGDTAPGKSLHAKDLRSDEVQKQSDETIGEVIAKGRGKMPAFGAKVKPEGLQQLVAYIRSLPAKK